MGGGSPMGGGGNFHAPTGYGGATGGGPMMGGSAGGNPMAGSTNSGTGSKIDVQYVMKKCPNTMHCMTTCPQGYRLGGEGKDGCPLCTCLGKQGEVMQGLPHQNTLQGLGNLQKGKKTGKQTEQIESEYNSLYIRNAHLVCKTLYIDLLTRNVHFLGYEYFFYQIHHFEISSN